MPVKKVEKGWIKVKDAKPDYGVAVLVVVIGDFIFIGERFKTDDRGDHYCYRDGQEVVNKVTHWMPLPKLPYIRKAKKLLSEREEKENDGNN
jgi:hypothetical protein